MCGRFANHLDELDEWADLLDEWPGGATTGFNVSPTGMIPVLTIEGLQTMRWSLVPPWANSVSARYSTFNARIETAAEKATFRHAWHARQFCLIPTSGYYEWRDEGGARQPYFVHVPGGAPLVYAGLWEPSREGGIPSSCTILTEAASGHLRDLHARKPVFIARHDASGWLERGTQGISSAAVAVKYHSVSRAVNNARAQGPELIRPQASSQLF